MLYVHSTSPSSDNTRETGERLLESALQQELKHRLIYCLYAAANIAAALPYPGAPQRGLGTNAVHIHRSIYTFYT